MPTNDFQPFATGGSANVISQSGWLALAALSNGFAGGTEAVSAQFNKAFRQSIWGTAALAQLIVNQLAVNVNDDGNLTVFVGNLTAAIASAASGVAVRFNEDHYTGSPLSSLTYTLSHPPLAQGHPPAGGLFLVSLGGQRQPPGSSAVSGTTLTLSGVTIGLYSDLIVDYNY